MPSVLQEAHQSQAAAKVELWRAYGEAVASKDPDAIAQAADALHLTQADLDFHQLVMDWVASHRAEAESLDQRHAEWLKAEEAEKDERELTLGAWAAHKRRVRVAMGATANARARHFGSQLTAERLNAVGEVFPFLLGIDKPPRPVVASVEPGNPGFPAWALPAEIQNARNQLEKQKAAAEKNRG